MAYVIKRTLRDYPTSKFALVDRIEKDWMPYKQAETRCENSILKNEFLISRSQ